MFFLDKWPWLKEPHHLALSPFTKRRAGKATVAPGEGALLYIAWDICTERADGQRPNVSQISIKETKFGNL